MVILVASLLNLTNRKDKNRNSTNTNTQSQLPPNPITNRNPADLQQHSKRLSLYLICLDYPDFADLGIRVLRVHVRGQVSP